MRFALPSLCGWNGRLRNGAPPNRGNCVFRDCIISLFCHLHMSAFHLTFSVSQALHWPKRSLCSVRRRWIALGLKILAWISLEYFCVTFRFDILHYSDLRGKHYLKNNFSIRKYISPFRFLSFLGQQSGVKKKKLPLPTPPLCLRLKFFPMLYITRKKRICCKEPAMVAFVRFHFRQFSVH